jgi:hypothetical protein
MYKLTAEQVRHFDEISFDKMATNNTLEIALQYHSNKMVEIETDKRTLWEELAAVHGFDLQSAWEVKKVNGAVYIVEKKDKE